MSDINTETGEPLTAGGPRFTTWCALALFSVVTLASSVEVRSTSSTSDGAWALGLSAVAFSFAALVVLMHLHPVSLVLISGTKLEGVLGIIVVGLSSAIVSIVSDASNNLVSERYSNPTQ